MYNRHFHCRFFKIFNFLSLSLSLSLSLNMATISTQPSTFHTLNHRSAASLNPAFSTAIAFPSKLSGFLSKPLKHEPRSRRSTAVLVSERNVDENIADSAFSSNGSNPSSSRSKFVQ